MYGADTFIAKVERGMLSIEKKNRPKLRMAGRGLGVLGLSFPPSAAGRLELSVVWRLRPPHTCLRRPNRPAL